jgi:hypothetical protein
MVIISSSQKRTTRRSICSQKKERIFGEERRGDEMSNNKGNKFSAYYRKRSGRQMNVNTRSLPALFPFSLF